MHSSEQQVCHIDGIDNGKEQGKDGDRRSHRNMTHCNDDQASELTATYVHVDRGSSELRGLFGTYTNS